MKDQIRILGVDDAPFAFKEGNVDVIGAILRGSSYLECVLKTQVVIDGTDATASLTQMINSSRYKTQIKATLIDGVALGGFNVIDAEELFESTEIPVITITRNQPDFESMKRVLTKNFDDWQERWNKITSGALEKVQTAHSPIYVKTTGISLMDAEEIIKICTIRGVLPEPVRVAHLIASGITRGESYGKA